MDGSTYNPLRTDETHRRRGESDRGDLMYADEQLSDFERTIIIEAWGAEKSAPSAWQMIYSMGGALRPLLFCIRDMFRK